jgi:hypothetical protein
MLNSTELLNGRLCCHVGRCFGPVAEAIERAAPGVMILQTMTQTSVRRDSVRF